MLINHDKGNVGNSTFSENYKIAAKNFSEESSTIKIYNDSSSSD